MTDDERKELVKRLRAEDISGHGKYTALVRDAAAELEHLSIALNIIGRLAYRRGQEDMRERAAQRAVGVDIIANIPDGIRALPIQDAPAEPTP